MRSRTIIAMHGLDDHQLAHVREEMLRLGAPTIRVIETDQQGVYAAIEGTHRLAVAAELGLRPRIEILRAKSDEIVNTGQAGRNGTPIFRPFGWLREMLLDGIREGESGACYQLDRRRTRRHAILTR